jgi:hypothetical protein
MAFKFPSLIEAPRSLPGECARCAFSKGIHNLPSIEFEKGTGMSRSVLMWIQFQDSLPLPIHLWFLMISNSLLNCPAKEAELAKRNERRKG